MADSSIHQLVNPRHRKRIFQTSSVQIREIHAHSPFSVLFPHYHSIGQPFRIEDLFDSPRLLKLHHLISDSIRMFSG